MELPVLFLELNGCQVLLVGALLMVKCKEQGAFVELGEVFSAVEHGHSGEHVIFVVDGDGVFWVLGILVKRSRHVPVGGVKQLHHMLDSV